jgi:hypothetical protein
MVDYIDGAIREAIEKGRTLMLKIPGARQLGLHFNALAATANNEIEQVITSLEFLMADSDYNIPQNIREKFSRFKQYSNKLSKIENVVIAAMSRKTDDDDFVNKLVQEICREINYPLQAPVTSCLSQKYYHIYSSYNLLCMPLLESDFLLHLPDIYHELGHPLIELSNPKVEAFQKSLAYFLIEVRKHFNEEIKRREVSKVNANEFDSIFVWRDSWLENWASELFCDLFATYTLGPAYIWSNIHMCTKMSWEPYKLPSFQKESHPPGEARMKAVLYGLDIINFKEDGKLILNKWNQFKQIIGEEKPQEFSLAVPEKLLKLAAEHCLVGIKQIKCEIANEGTTERVYTLLNNSWKEFWKNPKEFSEWERQTVTNFRDSLRN